MSSLAVFRDAIVAGIKTAIPALKTCEDSKGKLDLAEIKRLGSIAPAIQVVCVGTPGTSVQGGMVVVDTRWGAFVITKDAVQPKVDRGDVATALVMALLGLVPVTRWGLTDVQVATGVKAENLYSGELDQQALALWVVSWSQKTDLDPNVALAGVDEFLRVNAQIASSSPASTPPAERPVESTDQVTLEGA